MAKMKELPTDDVVFGKGRLRENDREIHDMHLFKIKTSEESREPWDYYKVLGTVAGEKASARRRKMSNDPRINRHEGLLTNTGFSSSLSSTDREGKIGHSKYGGQNASNLSDVRRSAR